MIADHFASDATTDVALGLPLGGIVRTWDGDHAQTWRVDDAEYLADLCGTGAIEMTQLDRGRYRERAVLDSDAGALGVAVTTPVSTLGGRIEGVRTFNIVPAGATDGFDDTLWQEFEDILLSAMTHAFDRGEVVTIGGPDTDGPQVTIGVVMRVSQRMLVLSAAPAPIADCWPTPEPDALDRTSIIELHNPMTPLEAALRTSAALASWDIAPHDATITYVSPIEMMTASLPWEELAAAGSDYFD